MAPPDHTAFRRHLLRRPTYILAFFVLAYFAPFMRDIVFDAQHSTRIAVKTQTATEPAARARDMSNSKAKTRASPLGEHTFRPDGLLEVNPRAAHPIFALVVQAEAAWAAKLARASTSLRQAAAEYTHRYKRLPPAGFDLWWGYVAARDVQLPDEYDQIERDLAPLYGVAPDVLQSVQRAWEAHADSYTIGKDTAAHNLSMLNFTLPEDEAVRFQLARGAFEIIELLEEVENELPPFRAVFSPHDSPNLVTDHELKQQALEAARKGTYIDPMYPPPEKHGWPAACPPFSPAQLDALPPAFDEAHPNTGSPSVPGTSSNIFEIDHPRRGLQTPPKTFIHDHRTAMDPCLHPSHLRTHGAYLPHGEGPAPQRVLIPQFSYSTTPLHSDIRPALPLNWVPDDFPHEGRMPPLGLSWTDRTDERLQWRGSNTGIWHAGDGRWREAHRIRLAALAAGMGGVNASVLMAPMLTDQGAEAEAEGRQERERGGRIRDGDQRHVVPTGEQALPVGMPQEVSRARFVNALLDVAFAGKPVNCEGIRCTVLEEMFEWRAPHDLPKAGKYKYVLDVDGNGWSSRFKRLMNSGSLIFKATGYPEWFTDRIAPWVHYIPIQNSYADLLDALVFFRGDPAGRGAHDDMAARIAAAGREWSRRYWRKEDLVAYNYRLFLEYARVMSTDREATKFVMWEDDAEDEARERELRERWRQHKT
ncbi:glycosyl transferase family 90-domain-containing protein [Mycena pura]|uniref:Glycosyl transferase family 90-domain-containing protein n=1 Tax=Mycena pura TaxID=153505 RepID=A0AAD7E428_9AGAR|nr:glycosyl transferase family 90-domain-containing protein [Mycena pura]